MLDGKLPSDLNLLAIEKPSFEPPARLVVDPPLQTELSHGLLVVSYRAEHLRFAEVYGAAGSSVVPRIGHLHITVDDSAWHWVDASGKPVIVQGLAPGSHFIRLDLADPTHRVVDSHTIRIEVPPRLEP